MKPRISIITLAVSDLQRAMHFYKNGLGLPTKGITEGFEDHVLFEMQEGLSLVLYLQSEVNKISGNDEDRKGASVILSYAAKDVNEVKQVLEQARKAGAVFCGYPQQQPWGYFAYFKDPDGHLWEIMCGPEADAP